MAASQLLLGRVALVTGGGSGIGRAVCHVFAREKAQVVVADIDEGAARNTATHLTTDDGIQHLPCGVDVCKPDSVSSLLNAVREKLQRVPDVVVNCAGITRDGFMVDMTESMFDDVLRVNLKGTFLVTQAASRLMIQEKVTDGSIINVSSVVGKVGNMGQCNYAASKAGVEGFTKSVAKELAKFGIRCNAVMPGFIETPMIATVPDKVMEKIKQQIPLRRTGKPEEIADACVFLASNRSSYITGTIIQVSGGLFM